MPSLYSSDSDGAQILCLLTLSQMTNFRHFETETICRRQFFRLIIMVKVLHICRKHFRKRRNCSLQAMSPFLTVFSKDLYCRHIKTRAIKTSSVGSVADLRTGGCFDNGYVGKQPVVLKEYCADYWLKELQESMDRCTDHCDITEILLKKALKTIQSISHKN